MELVPGGGMVGGDTFGGGTTTGECFASGAPEANAGIPIKPTPGGGIAGPFSSVTPIGNCLTGGTTLLGCRAATEAGTFGGAVDGIVRLGCGRGGLDGGAGRFKSCGASPESPMPLPCSDSSLFPPFLGSCSG